MQQTNMSLFSSRRYIPPDGWWLVAGRWQVSWLADYGLLIQPSRFLMKTVAHVLRDQTRSIPPTVAGAASDYAFKATH
ncbi:hypothetical protein HC62_14205 [Acetobacter tropicalis]|uniref:Uncharacterized protein n=1 Tax=Acetobacter tropicalis TaxID=104102 RepID=A0A252AD47_9PROT|nr:hypothetical protein HC62_14205 [Acetobacter tropicalis]